MSEVNLREIRCPCNILERDGRVFNCGSLLCKAAPGSAIEIVCRKCKNKIFIVVPKDEKAKVKMKIKSR